MPHAFVLACGSTLEASKVYYAAHPHSKLVVLIDTYGRELTDSVELLRYWGKELNLVRIDTHGGRYCEGCVKTEDNNEFTEAYLGSGDSAVEYMFKKYGSASIAYCRSMFGKGVTVEAVLRLREALDKAGGMHVKIVASSGFTLEKVSAFERCNAPVDEYGCGLGRPEILMATADIVEIDGRPCHKTGRYEDSYKPGRFIPAGSLK